MGYVIGLIFEVLFGILLQGLFESIYYGLRRLWYWVTGQEVKEENAVTSHREAKEIRRERFEQIRQRRDEKKKR